MRVDRAAKNEAAASHVAHEWFALVDYAAQLDSIQGARTSAQNAVMEAALVHARCLITFLCGNYKGARSRADITPADFLVRPWSLPAEDDEQLRGYLPILNVNLAHLSWERLDDQVVILPVGFLAHLLSWHMNRFVDELERQDAPRRTQFRTAAERLAAILPPRKRWASTSVQPAPPRKELPSRG